RRVGSTVNRRQVRLLVRDEVGEQRDERQQQDSVETRHRAAIAPELAPDEARIALRALGVAHGVLPSNEIRGSTTASRKSASRMPSSVSNELMAKSPRTTG